MGNLYVRLASRFEAALAAGRIVVMEIDVQGGRQIAERMPYSVRVFLLLPSDEELARRLAGRRTETPSSSRSVWGPAARQEIQWARQWSCYPYSLVNETVERTVQDVIRIVEAEREQVMIERLKSDEAMK